MEKGNLGPRVWTEAINKWKSLKARKCRKINYRVMIAVAFISLTRLEFFVTWHPESLSKLS